MIDDLWYKNAVIYCLDVEKYVDANGDGVGDFAGLTRRLDYLAGLGITCLWLQPFYPSPNRDNGYDVSDYYGIHPKLGTLGDFVDFMNHADQIGIRVIVDLVVNHTSERHPWFQSARKHPDSPYRDWYLWSKTRPSDYNKGMVFPGVQKTTWTRDAVAGEYYFHRFYDFQPDLNTMHPAVRTEILRIMGFWLQLGVCGFRMDAVPFLISRKGAHARPQKDYEFLHEMRDFLQWRRRDAILLAEANVPPDESLEYFGELGDRLQMMLNFPVNQRIYYALATGDLKPLITRARSDEGAAAGGPVGPLPSQPRRTGSRPADRVAAGESLQRLRADQRHAAVRSRDPPPLRADGQQRSTPHRAGLQPALHATRHADAAVRRRNRHGRQPVAARARVRTHADAVVCRSQRRLLDSAAHRSAGHLGSDLRVSARQRRSAASRSPLAAELGRAQDSHAQGMPRDQLGRLENPEDECRRRAGDGYTRGTTTR